MSESFQTRENIVPFVSIGHHREQMWTYLAGDHEPMN